MTETNTSVMKTFTTSLFLIFFLSGRAQVLESYPATTALAESSNYINFNSKMFYFARNAQYEFSLYATDGTPSGNEIIKNMGFAFTVNLKDINNFNDYKIIFDNKLFFNFSNVLYQSDGTTAGTVAFMPALQNARFFKIFNNRLYFTAFSSASGVEIWSTDGTAAGTTLLKDIFPGTSNAFNNQLYDPHFTEFDNKLFFVANDGVHGYELWSTDGTAAGTTLFKDIRTNEGGTTSGFGAFLTGIYSTPNFAVMGGKMYFGANPHINDVAMGNYMNPDYPILYQTDGTSAGTFIVEPPITAAEGCDCGNITYNYLNEIDGLTVYNNKLFVFGRQVFHPFGGIINRGVYLVDGINPVTRLQGFTSLAGDAGTSDAVERYSMRMFEGNYYFLGKTYTNNDVVNLWKMNPVNHTFTQMTQANSFGASDFSDSSLDLRLLVAKEFNNKLYFVKTKPYEGKIFSTDGTVSGTQFEAKSSEQYVSNVAFSTQAMSVIPNAFGVLSDGIYFKAQFLATQPAAMWRIHFNNLSTTLFEKSVLQLFPNPTSSRLNFKLLQNVENGSLRIISLTGQTVIEKHNLHGNDFGLDVSALHSGMYILDFNDKNQSYSGKFLKN